MKNNNIVRYIVEHQVHLYQDGPLETVTASYNTALDSGPVSALSMAIHAACRHQGIIYKEDSLGNRAEVKNYLPKQQKVCI